MQEHRILRLPSEPRNLEEKVILLVRHPEFGTLHRFFRPDTMNVAYDWVGYLCLKLFWIIFKRFSWKIQTVLNFGILNQPLDFEKDCENMMPGCSNSLAKCIGTIEAKRDTEKFKLKNDTGSCFYVHRHN